MVFNSVEFLFFFLPLVVLVFYLLRALERDLASLAWLVMSSLFFYGWWNPVYLLLLLFSMAVNYQLGRWLARNGGEACRWLLPAGIAFNLALLGYFKYFNFFVDSVNAVLDIGFNVEKVVLPLAISFYTFQQITYLVDSRKRLTRSHGLLDYAIFVTFFPQLIAGPIVHHREMLVQFRELCTRGQVARNLSLGLSILAVGLFKKVVLADSFGLYASPVFDAVAQGRAFASVDVALATLAYALQLYFDFSAYSDMAIGLAALFGIRLPVNFFSPYKASSIIDFWKRWHMTLSRFLREYLYIPLGGNRRGEVRRQANLLITMLLGGLWHGANWTFLVWGGLHGLALVINHGWRRLVPAAGDEGAVFRAAIWRGFCCLLTFGCVSLAWVVFRAESLPVAMAMLSSLAQPDGLPLSTAYAQQLSAALSLRLLTQLLPDLPICLAALSPLVLGLVICWCLPNTYQIFAKALDDLHEYAGEVVPSSPIRWRPSVAWGAVSAVLLLAAFLGMNHVTEFLYFQF